MAKPIIKEKARTLRKKGLSIGEVSVKLNQPKSTVSYWCKNISLTKKQIQDIERRHKSNSIAILLSVSEKQRQSRIQREKEIEDIAREKLGSLSDRDIFILGLGLYWGEGYKYEHSEFGFTNSDPEMILSYLVWLERVFKVKKDAIICRVSINSLHKHRLSRVEKYWQDLIGISTRQFSKPSIINSKPKKIFQHNDTYFGTLRVKVRKGFELRHQVLASLEVIKEQLGKCTSSAI